MAFSQAATALPPYAPHWEGLAQLGAFLSQLDIANFSLLGDDALYWQSYLYSLRIAALTTLFALAIGYPLAYAMGLGPGALARPSADLRHPAVLDILSDPGLRLDRHPPAGRIARCNARLPRFRRRASAPAQHPRRPCCSVWSIPICPSWSCRSSRRWRSSIVACWRRQLISAPRR
jgi:hypothetical protein